MVVNPASMNSQAAAQAAEAAKKNPFAFYCSDENDLKARLTGDDKIQDLVKDDPNYGKMIRLRGAEYKSLNGDMAKFRKATQNQCPNGKPLYSEQLKGKYDEFVLNNKQSPAVPTQKPPVAVEPPSAPMPAKPAETEQKPPAETPEEREKRQQEAEERLKEEMAAKAAEAAEAAARKAANAKSNTTSTSSGKPVGATSQSDGLSNALQQ